MGARIETARPVRSGMDRGQRARDGRRQPQLPLRPAGPETVAALLAWYDNERRDLPWRYGRGAKPDPYRVWLSEIMLQQTTVKAATPYFLRFVERWPTVAHLAAAPQDDIMAMWAGLGYYSRARNLKACAEQLVALHGGKFPETESELVSLPGIGPYTAAAISAIAFGHPATPVDGNIERVVSRLFAVTTPLPASKPEIKRLAQTLTPRRRAGDLAQAMMDLGAEICTPRSPSCLMCPLQTHCAANATGLAETLPRRAAKAERPNRYGFVFVALNDAGEVLVRKRPDKGLLGGMLEAPTTRWADRADPLADVLAEAPIVANWRVDAVPVVHVFTHFRLELTVCRALVPRDAELTLWADQERCQWLARRDIGNAALPSVFRKALQHGLAAF